MNMTMKRKIAFSLFLACTILLSSCAQPVKTTEPDTVLNTESRIPGSITTIPGEPGSVQKTEGTTEKTSSDYLITSKSLVEGAYKALTLEENAANEKKLLQYAHQPEYNCEGGTTSRDSSKFNLGLGYDGYHPVENYSLSEATMKLDHDLMKSLNVDAIRTWSPDGGGWIDGKKAAGINVVPQIQQLDKNNFPGTVYAKHSDGSDAEYSIDFLSTANRDRLAQNARNLANTVKTRQDRVPFVLLGNEYSLFSQNRTGQYRLAGYGTDMLNDFRTNYLPARFGTIAKFRTETGATASSWATVNPNANTTVAYEFWRYLRQGFNEFMKIGYDAFKSVAPEIPVTYAALMGRLNPTCDDAGLNFLDYGGQNLYPNWFEDFSGYAAKLDNLCSLNPGKPIMITETGQRTMFDDMSAQQAARAYKQQLALLFMRSQVQGIFSYSYSDFIWAGMSPDDPQTTWGIVTGPYRTPKPTFFSVKKLYADFVRFNSRISKPSYTPLVTISNQFIDEMLTNGWNYNEICRILSAKGIPYRTMYSEDMHNVANYPTNKLILMDDILANNPDGSKDAKAGLKAFLNKNGTSMLSFSAKPPKSLYNNGAASTWEEEYKAFAAGKVSLSSEDNVYQYDLAWDALAPFVQGDFVQGKVTPKANTIDNDAVRIIDLFSDTDPMALWDMQAHLMYSNGRVVLMLCNTSPMKLENIKVTVGINNGIKFYATPSVIGCDSDIVVSKAEAASIPEWVPSTGVVYQTINIDNFDTYAFIDLGVAKQ